MIDITQTRNLCLKNAFKTVKSKIKNQNAKLDGINRIILLSCQKNLYYKSKFKKSYSRAKKTSRYTIRKEYGFSGEYAQLLTSLIFALYF